MQLVKLLSLALLVQARKDQLDSSQQTINAAASDSETADAISDFLNDNAGQESSTTSVTSKVASVASTTSTTTGHASQAKTEQKVTSTTTATTRASTTTTTTLATTTTTTTAMTTAPPRSSTTKAHKSAPTATAKPGVFLAKEQQKSNEAQERAELKRELYTQVKAEMEKEFQVELKQQLAEARAKMETLAKVTAAKTATTSTPASATTSTTTTVESRPDRRRKSSFEQEGSRPDRRRKSSFEQEGSRPDRRGKSSFEQEGSRPDRRRKSSFVQEGKQAANERKGHATLAAAIAAHAAETEVEAALRSQAFGSVESEFNVFDMPTYEKTTTATTTSIATTSSSVKLSRSHWFSGAFISTEHLAQGMGEKLLSWEQASPVHRVWAKIDGWFAKRGSQGAIATTSKPEAEHKSAGALIQSPHAASAADQAKWEAERLRNSHVEDIWADYESQDNEFQAELDKDDAMEQS